MLIVLVAVAVGPRAAHARMPADSSADHYIVHFYSGELRELGTLETAGAPTLTISPGALAAASAGDTVVWRVIALQGQRVLGQSDLGSLRMP